MKRIAYVRAGSIFNDSRATKEIKTLLEMGFYISVIGWDKKGGAAEKCIDVFREYSGSIDFFFYSQTVVAGNGMKNFLKFYDFTRFVRRVLKKLDHVEIVHACDFDAGWGAYLYVRQKKIPLVYDIYDYYIDSHSIPGPLRGIFERSEIQIINHAETTIICTEERREQIAKARPKNVRVIYNSPEISNYVQYETDLDYVYCGALNEHRLIREIFEAYSSNADLRFQVAGGGKLSELAIENANTFENFQYSGSIPYDKVLEYEKRAVALSAIYEPVTRNNRLCAPNKFYEALALGKPIIVCRNTGIDKIVEEQRLGLVIDYNADQFYQAIRFLKSNPLVCDEMGKNGRALYEKRYSWKKMKDILEDIYRNLEW